VFASQPALTIAGAINFVQISRSERDFLSSILSGESKIVFYNTQNVLPMKNNFVCQMCAKCAEKRKTQ
jgi:hypothetical protein